MRETERVSLWPSQADHPTGYPPVTRTEEEAAARTAQGETGRSASEGGSTRLPADQEAITDAIAAVMEKHRAQIASAPISSEARRYAGDLLDGVHLDLLQTVLDEASALQLMSGRRGAGT
jgi:hypothetical protein